MLLQCVNCVARLKLFSAGPPHMCSDDAQCHVCEFIFPAVRLCARAWFYLTLFRIV